MFVGARADQRAVFFAELELAPGGVFGDHQGVGREERLVGGASEEAEGLGVGVFEIVGWVEVDEVGGLRGEEFGEALEELSRAAVFHGVGGCWDFEGGEIGTESFQGRDGVLAEEDMGGAAAEGFDADGAGAGVKVEEAAAGEAWGEDVEEGFAEAIAGGAGGVAGRAGEEAGAIGAGDDAHRGS